MKFDMSWKWTLVCIAILAVLHFVFTVTLIAMTLSLGMDGFDTGAEPTIIKRVIERVCDPVVTVLIFPGYQIYQISGIRNNTFEWFTVVGTSVFWGVAMFGILTAIIRVPALGTQGTSLTRKGDITDIE